jgi:transposase
MLDRQQVEVDEREEIVGRVAAIDVAKASGMVCTRVPHATKAGKRSTTVWQVPSTTNQVLELAEQLAGEGSSGSWSNPLLTLGGRSCTCWRRGGWWCGWSTPATSSTCRAGPRPTSWMRCGCASRSERGMLRPSFVPPAQIRRLREDTRLRADLTADRSRHKQRVEKLLEDALIKLSTVATDIFGVSGRAMLEALIAGQRDPKVLAELARGRLRVKHAALGGGPHRPLRRSSRRTGEDAAGPDRRPQRPDRPAHRADRADDRGDPRRQAASANTRPGRRHRGSHPRWDRAGRVGAWPPRQRQRRPPNR